MSTYTASSKKGARKDLLRVVLDTIIHVSAAHRPAGRDAVLWNAACSAGYVLLVSPALVAELPRVLRIDFGWVEAKVQKRIRDLAHVAELVQTHTRLAIVTA